MVEEDGDERRRGYEEEEMRRRRRDEFVSEVQSRIENGSFRKLRGRS